MGLQRKIDKEAFDKLSDAAKEFYHKVGENYILDLDGDDDALTAAKNETAAEKARRLALEEQIRESEAAAAKLREDALKSEGNVAELEKLWQGKVDAATASANARVEATQGQLRTVLVGTKAQEMAMGLSSKAGKLLAPLIAARMGVKLDGDTPSLVVLGADGKETDLTMDQLREEFYTNADYAGIIDGSKATGGNGKPNHQPQKGQQPNNAFREEKTVDLSKASASDLVAHINASKQ